MKQFARERHGDNYLFRLKRSNQVVAGVTPDGKTVTMQGLTDNLTDDEWLELLRATSQTAKGVQGATDKFIWIFETRTGELVELVRLMPNHWQGSKLAEVRLTQSHRYKGKRGDIVPWLWEDLVTIIGIKQWAHEGSKASFSFWKELQLSGYDSRGIKR